MNDNNSATSNQSSSARIKLRTVGTETVASYSFRPQPKQNMPSELKAFFVSQNSGNSSQ